MPSTTRTFLRHQTLNYSTFHHDFSIIRNTGRVLPQRTQNTALLAIRSFLPLSQPKSFNELGQQLLPTPCLTSVSTTSTLIYISRTAQSHLAYCTPRTQRHTRIVPLTKDSLVNSRPRPMTSLINTSFTLIINSTSTHGGLSVLVSL